MTLGWFAALKKCQKIYLIYRGYLRFGIIASLLLLYYFCLPEKLIEPPYSAALYSDSGQLISVRIAKDEQWRLTPQKNLPEKFKTALITFEDKRFIYHFGVDPIALSRAIFNNLFSAKRLSGASTLTMQSIRLMRHNPPRTYWEKLKEMILATRLEWRLSKQEIIALYAAHAPFGGNVVGIEAASWRYFGRAPRQLSWAESAMLAVLPNNPSMIHLQKNRDRLKVKRDKLLDKLEMLGHLSKLDLSLAKVEPIPKYRKHLPRFAPHLLDTLSRFNPKKDDLSSTQFATFLDAKLQKKLSRSVFEYSEQLKKHGIQHAAALVIDNQTMRLKAYVGNAQYNNQFQSGYAIQIWREASAAVVVF
ncbi:MAG: transglycosylase domain-containing protein [Enterobacterales bacterium]|nr:transglycosylase domain-containing protein [Enterobacterales bacterium]